MNFQRTMWGCTQAAETDQEDPGREEVCDTNVSNCHLLGIVSDGMSFYLL